MVSDAPTPQLPKEVDVTLLLEGGQQHTVKLQSGNPLVQQLFETLVNRTDNRPQRLFQVPVKEGKAVLCFPSDRLVGIVTEPPLVLQQNQVQQSQAAPVSDPLAPGI